MLCMRLNRGAELRPRTSRVIWIQMDGQRSSVQTRRAFTEPKTVLATHSVVVVLLAEILVDCRPAGLSLLLEPAPDVLPVQTQPKTVPSVKQNTPRYNIRRKCDERVVSMNVGCQPGSHPLVNHSRLTLVNLELAYVPHTHELEHSPSRLEIPES